MSSEGHICLVPEKVKPGDRICLFAGSRVPLVIRPNYPPKLATIVGAAYVHGVMDGEAWDSERLQYLEIA